MDTINQTPIPALGSGWVSGDEARRVTGLRLDTQNDVIFVAYETVPRGNDDIELVAWFEETLTAWRAWQTGATAVKFEPMDEEGEE